MDMMNPISEEELLSHYGGDDKPADDPFWNEIHCARQHIENILGWPFWVEVAECEMSANRGLAFVNPPLQDALEDHAPAHLVHEKVFRYLRVAAYYEAITGQDLGFHFYSDLARYVYPKLVRRVATNLANAPAA